jgi:hypothetical protein
VQRTRAAVLVLAILAPLLTGWIAFSQAPLPSGVFEFGVQRSFEGVIYETPVPTLRMAERDADGGAPAVSNLLLVGAGKAGMPEFALGHEGKKVRFDGSLIYRENMTMVEMNDPESFEVLGDPEPWETRQREESVGDVVLVGEIVDTKCFFGVMRPATGKVHRACAIRCLSGGVPPGLLVRDEHGDGVVFMLAGRAGENLDLDVEWAARYVRAAGALEMHDGIPVLRVREMELVDG